MKSVTSNIHRSIARINSLLICLISFVLLASTAYAQADLSGYWLLKFPNGDGTFRESYLELKQSGGESLTGNLLGRGLNGIPITGSFKDSQLHFATAVSTGRQAVYDGTFDKGKLLLQTTRGPL